MSLSRRNFIAGLLTVLTPTTAFTHPGRHKHPHKGRPIARRQRNRRWRVRRHVAWQSVNGRRLLIVPVAVMVGWELMVDSRVVVVKEVHPHRIAVEHVDGSWESIEIIKQDTSQNVQQHTGSEYANM